jgi:hypothetical protein
MTRVLSALLLAVAAANCAARAEETVVICYDYGCVSQARIRYSDAQLAAVRHLLAGAQDAARERLRVALVIGRLYSWAGSQSPIHNDRGGDYADDAADGRMDCIDHAQSTTRLLRMLEARGWLRFHRVLAPARRTRYFVTQHFSAVVQENAAARRTTLVAGTNAPQVGDEGSGARFVIDTWFLDNGMPAVVLPLDDWMNGAGPDV